MVVSNTFFFFLPVTWNSTSDCTAFRLLVNERRRTKRRSSRGKSWMMYESPDASSPEATVLHSTSSCGGAKITICWLPEVGMKLGSRELTSFFTVSSSISLLCEGDDWRVITIMRSACTLSMSW